MRPNLEKYNPKVASFSMEVHLEHHRPTYSGGLGILQGDILRSCADLGVPIVNVSQISSSGYFMQGFDKEYWQLDSPVHWSPLDTLERLGKTVEIYHKGRKLIVGAEFCEITGETGFKIPVILVDTNFEGNNNEDRKITGALYDSDDETRISQENVLGQGGLKLLRALGYNSIKAIDLNECHTVFAGLENLIETGDINLVRKTCKFTNHTPIGAGFEKWDMDKVRYIVGDKFLPSNIFGLSGDNKKLNMTLLGVNLSDYVGGVSKKHAEVCSHRDEFKGREVKYITNGIHPRTWAVSPIARLYDEHFKYWSIDPRILEHLPEHIPYTEFSEAKTKAKANFVDWINSTNPVKFNPRILTIVWARRGATYKRPELLFKDLDRLHKIAEKYPLQIVCSGKAHPKDYEGKIKIQEVRRTIDKINGKNENSIRATFIESYDPIISLNFLGGADIWLNTPRRTREASGTSGMKAALNGCINLSTYDGWICEGIDMDPETIFLVGPRIEQTYENKNYYEEDNIDSNSLYNQLEIIAEEYYGDSTGDSKRGPSEKFEKRRAKAPRLISYFNTHRLVKEKARKVWEIEI